MRFALNEDQASLRDLVREVLDDKCTPAQVRASWVGVIDGSSPDGEKASAAARSVWQSLVEVGLPGMLVPESADGLGLDEVFYAAAMIECGYAAVPAPVVATLCAAPLLAGVDDDLVAGVIGGQALIAGEPTGAGLVPFGGVADAALLGGQPGTGGVRLIKPLTGEEVETVDGSRRAVQVLPGGGDPLEIDPSDVARYWQRGVLGQAAHLVGLARRCVQMTVDYTKDRQQFGKPIGAQQAVKHHLASASLAVEFAAPMVLWAAETMRTGDKDAAARAVASAKVMAAEAAHQASRAGIQCHGAIGYTTEYDLHLYAKRIWALCQTWGTPSELRAGLATSLGLPMAGNVARI